MLPVAAIAAGIGAAQRALGGPAELRRTVRGHVDFVTDVTTEAGLELYRVSATVAGAERQDDGTWKAEATLARDGLTCGAPRAGDVLVVFDPVERQPLRWTVARIVTEQPWSYALEVTR